MAVLGRLNSFTWFIYTQGGSHRTTSSSDYHSHSYSLGLCLWPNTLYVYSEYV